MNTFKKIIFSLTVIAASLTDATAQPGPATTSEMQGRLQEALKVALLLPAVQAARETESHRLVKIFLYQNKRICVAGTQVDIKLPLMNFIRQPLVTRAILAISGGSLTMKDLFDDRIVAPFRAGVVVKFTPLRSGGQSAGGVHDDTLGVCYDVSDWDVFH